MGFQSCKGQLTNTSPFFPKGYVNEVVFALKVQLPNSVTNVVAMQFHETYIIHEGISQDRGLHDIAFDKNKL